MTARSGPGWQVPVASRLGGQSFGTGPTEYKFEAIKRARAAARMAHPDLPLIDLGVGEPDEPADPLVTATLGIEAGRAENRFYADNGIPEFRRAAVRYLESVYGVAGLDPDTEVVHGLGSKQILALLPLAFLNPGDVLLTTVPGYPVMATQARYLGAEVHELPLMASNAFLPDLSSVPAGVLARAKVLYLNYPNNPTGAVASPGFFRSVVAFARRHGVLVIHDAAYGALTYDPAGPLSFLSVEGAREVGLEVHSLSKAFCMTGWRMGFVAGNPRAVAAYAAVKDNFDSGQFRAVQKAAATALAHPRLTEGHRARYSRRLDLLVGALRRLGFDGHRPGGTFYAYVPAPVGTRDGDRFATAAEAAQFLLSRALVSTVPWDEAGAFLRVSATFEASGEADEVRVIDELERRLAPLNLIFVSQESV